MNTGGVRPRPLRPIGKLLAEDTRRHHRSLILQHLFAEGPASRADLARASGLTRVTVSDLVGGLISDGLLGELGSPAESKVGKPPTLVGLLPDAAHIVALDLSSLDRMAGAVVNLSGQVKARAEVPLDGACGQEAVGIAVGLAERLRASIDRPVLGVGVGTPGVVDGRGVVLDAHNLHWAGVDLTGILRRRLDLPVYVANDANTAVLAEYTFGGTTAADLMLLRIETGVGAGLVVGGALVEGHAWAAGEIGHVVVDPGARPAPAAGPAAWKPSWPRRSCGAASVRWRPSVPCSARCCRQWWPRSTCTRWCSPDRSTCSTANCGRRSTRRSGSG